MDAALLAILALQGPMPRAALAGMLWPQRLQAQALTNLRQRLRQLRQALPGLHAPAGGPVALVSVPSAAPPAPAAAARPTPATPSHRPAAAPAPLHDLIDPLTTLEQDPDALDGPLLGRHDYADTPALAAWVRQARASWVARLRDTHAELANRHEAGGRIAQALRHAARLVRDEPTNEHGVRLLMRLHYRRGDRGAALAAYERCVQVLHDQFGEAVSDETARLGEVIARQAQEAPAPVRAMPVVLRHPPVTVGRESLLSIAEQRWAGQRVVLLAGPAGIGKSRLLAELCQRSATPQVVKLGADDAAAPLGLLLRLVRQLSGQWPSSGTAASLTADLERRLAAAAAQGPLHLAIEDLHFADPDSLAALVRLLPPAGPPGVHWWLTTRNRPLPAPLEAWLGRHEDVPLQLELPEWTPAQVEQFLATVGGPAVDLTAWAQALQRHCGGHPLHILWVLRALHEQGAWGQAQPPEHLPRPVEMKGLVARRLDGSDALTQQIAFVGALAGVDFDAALVARVTGRRASELAVHWRRLEAQGILRGRGFSHELMRQAVLEAVPEALQSLLHEEIAQALPDREGGYERRGAHWQAAGHPVRAAADLARAADEALHRGLPTRALDLLSRAEVLEAAHGDPDRLFALRWRSARLAVAWDTVVRALELTALLMDSARDDRQRSLAGSMRAFARAEQHDAAALDDAEQALSLAQACGDPAALVQALLRRAQALHVAGRTGEALVALQALRDAPPMDLSTPDADDLEDTLCLVLAALGRRREVVVLAEAAVASAQAAGQWQRAAEMASIAGVNLCYLCELSRSIQACEQSLAWCQRIGAERGSVFVDMMTLAGLYMDAGRFEEAVRMGETAADGLREAGLTGWIANAEHSLASMFMILGRHDLTARHLAELPDDAPLWTRAAREMLRGVQVHLRTGDSPLGHLLRAQAMFRQVGEGIGPFVHHRINAEIAAWSPAAEALPLLADAEAWALDQEQVTLRRVVRRLRVEVLLKAGQVDAAVEAADALEGDFAGRWEAVNFYLPDVWRSLVRAWDAGGQTRRADALAAHALDWVLDRWRTQVPPAFRDTYLQDNRTNRWLLERTGMGHLASS